MRNKKQVNLVEAMTVDTYITDALTPLCMDSECTASMTLDKSVFDPSTFEPDHTW